MQQTRLNNIATYMEEHAKSRVMYECANLMMPKPSTRFMIVDTTGQRQTRPEMNIKPVTEHYKKQLNRDMDEVLSPWRGEPRALQNPITRPEIVEAFKRLKNNKATGPDELEGELFKYGGDELVNMLQDLLINKMFTTHAAVKDIGEGFLYPMNKPDKPKRVENTRPLTFLN